MEASLFQLPEQIGVLRTLGFQMRRILRRGILFQRSLKRLFYVFFFVLLHFTSERPWAIDLVQEEKLVA